MLDATGELNRMEMAKMADPEIQVRIAQYEMAFRMQTSVPELTDISKEPESTFKLYGDDARKPVYIESSFVEEPAFEREVLIEVFVAHEPARVVDARQAHREPRRTLGRQPQLQVLRGDEGINRIRRPCRINGFRNGRANRPLE